MNTITTQHRWMPLRRVPSKGDRVRVIAFGDDYQRDGNVHHASQGWVWVDFVSKTERFHATDLEVWCQS